MEPGRDMNPTFYVLTPLQFWGCFWTRLGILRSPMWFFSKKSKYWRKYKGGKFCSVLTEDTIARTGLRARARSMSSGNFTLLKTNASKFTRGLEPLYGDACSAKSLEVLTLVFSTDCSPIDWLQSALKIKRFENIFLFFSLFWKSGVTFVGGEIGLVRCLGRSCCSESELWQEELFCIANHSAASQLFVDRISAPCPWHAVAPRRAQKRPLRGNTGCVIVLKVAGKFGWVYL